MSKHFVQSAGLRSLLLKGYRTYARAQWWRSGPRIFINSIPKAGTHLLAAELEKFPQVQNSRLHINSKDVFVDHRIGGIGNVVDFRNFQASIEEVRPGQFFTAHLPFDPGFVARLDDGGVRTLFVMRDPRDILVSRLHYVKGLRRHSQHDLFTSRLETDEERLRILLEGNDARPHIVPFRTLLERFAPWAQAPGVLTVRFEDLVGERGGGTTEAKHNTLRAVAEHCGLPAGQVERYAATAAKATATLRRGQANAWRESLPPDIIEAVHRECGALIAEMGYPAA